MRGVSRKWDGELQPEPKSTLKAVGAVNKHYIDTDSASFEGGWGCPLFAVG